MVKGSKIAELHNKLQDWKSHLGFIGGEMAFIDKLLNSYVFEPRTPNLFERLEHFKQGFETAKKAKEQLQKSIVKHEKYLGGIVECTTDDCDKDFRERHEKLEASMREYLEGYLNLKSEVYNYAGTVLKRKKPMD